VALGRVAVVVGRRSSTPVHRWLSPAAVAAAATVLPAATQAKTAASLAALPAHKAAPEAPAVMKALVKTCVRAVVLGWA
jgi:hypothetical protein